MYSYHANRLILVLVALGGACLVALPVSSDEKKPAPLDRGRIDKRIREIQPTAQELRFDAIGWASDSRRPLVTQVLQSAAATKR